MTSNQAEGTAENGTLNPIFPLARYCFQGPLRHYYPFGNVPAEDFLEHCIKSSHPTVLVLGCGDLRSCFYTLWKNFDFSISNAPKRFEGVKFVMNDRSAPIIARNLVFLYLCLQLPQEESEKVKWLSAMWAIWYCHELYPKHSKLLNSTLEILIKFSTSLGQWSNKSNPLHQFVQFTSPLSLSEVAEVCKMWFNKSVHVDSVRSMHESRNEKLTRFGMHNRVLETENVLKNTFVFGNNEEENELRANSRIQETRSYYSSGNCFAEDVLDISLPRIDMTEINITMYEVPDGRYTCHYALLPFQCYYHTVEFSKKSMKFKESPVALDMIVSSKSFESRPYLANSVQQFAMWILSSSRVLKNKEFTVLFSFDCRDAITYCQEQNHSNCDLTNNKTQYDIITTSNLIDHVGLPNLVLACVPLLNIDGLLVTSSLKIRTLAITGEEFMNMCFGFSCQLIPVILGIHCISYDGADYSSPVFIKAAPPDLTHFSKSYSSSIKTFLWTKLPPSQTLVFSQLPQGDYGDLKDAIVKACTSCSYSLLNFGLLSSTCISTGIETAMAMLKCLISHSDDSVHNYSYWEPICTALRSTATPFLHCLQTQMLVHGFHIHLLLDEENCPICKQMPLDQTLGLFCLDLDLSSYKDNSLNFVAYFHQVEIIDSNNLHMKAQKGDNVHIFDCFDVTTANDFKLHLQFFSPLSFAEKNYNVTVAIVQKTNTLNKVAMLHTTTLKSLKVEWKEYVFYPVKSRSKSLLGSPNDLFGRVTSHIVGSSKSETKVILTEATLKSLSTTNLKTEKISHNIINIYCGSTKFQLISSFPINYGKVNLKLSKSAGFMTISCQRQSYNLREERPCFIVSPDHMLSIVPRQLSKELLQAQSGIQLTQKEKEYLKNTPFIQRRTLPILDVKAFVEELFDNVSDGSFLYEIHTDNVFCLIMVNELLFDYNHRSPALDLAFCFIQDYDESFVGGGWRKLLQSLKGMHVKLTKKGGEFLQEVLRYFAERSNGTLLRQIGENRYAHLHKHNLESVFTRAVLYYLSIDPDNRQWVPKPLFSSNSQPRCAYCSKTSSNLTSCTQCRSIQYCNQTCRNEHYFKHEKLCSFIREGGYTPIIHIPHIPIDVTSIKMM